MQSALDIGKLRFGKYRAVREIGRGATSLVYLAEEDHAGAGGDVFGHDGSSHAGAPRRVAVKVVDFTDDRSKLSRRFRKLFATEAAVTAQFDHPNIARVFDWRVEDKRAYLVMELVEGTGLDQFVTMDKLLPMHRVVGIIFKVAMALDYAHRRGIVHRDIKPANVMLTKDDEVKLMDFGLALNIRKNVNVDSTFINGLGSPSYMSPEQIKGYTLNHQTDLYSLGVMFYQLLTGRLPFRGPNTAALVYKIINTEAVPVTQLNPDLPELTNKVLVRALEKDLYSRYRLGADMAKDLSSVRFQILQDGQALPDETKWKAVRGLPLLGKLDDVDVWELLRLSAWRVLAPATVIMKDGDPGKSFGFIIDGEVEVEKGDRALAKLKRGDIVGEVGFLHSEAGRRTASVTTLNQVTFLEINPAAFAFATEELAAEIRRIAIDAMVARMGEANRLARHFSPVAVHPSPLPEGEADVPAAGVAPRLAAEAPGWSVFAKPQRVVAGFDALPAAAPPAAAAPGASSAAPPIWAPAYVPDPAPARAPAPAANAPRTTTVVVQPLPASAAAVIAQMALTQHPKAGTAPQPFELGPEATGEMVPALPVSELPGDAVLTTELGAHFDAMSEVSTTKLDGGFVSHDGGMSTSEMVPSSFAQPAVATSEMAPDFGHLPQVAEPEMLAPDFDVHARTGRGQTQASQAAHVATSDMAASLGPPGQRPARTPPGPAGTPARSLMPATRPIADQSTQELAGHFLSAPNRGREADPMDELGRDMFPPLIHSGEDGDGDFTADQHHEATQLFNPDEPYEATQLFDADEPYEATQLLDSDEPYEATQTLDSAGFETQQSASDPGGHAGALPSSAGYEVTVEFDAAALDEFDRTLEIAGGFRTVEESEPPLPELFPPIKP
jgi:non-specific serine/threonine protein kinase